MSSRRSSERFTSRPAGRKGLVSLVIVVTAAILIPALVVALVENRDKAGGSGGTITLLLAGDVMLGRGVDSVVSTDPLSLFADIEAMVEGADVALANLESPFTTAPLVAAHPYDLRAPVDAASLIADAGFDVLGLANNHAGDAGPAGISDSIAAIEAAGMDVVGAGTAAESYEPLIRDVEGVRVAILAFDASGLGLPASALPGVAVWDDDARTSVARAHDTADLVVVGLHGGAAYVDADPVLWRAGREAVAAGADIVWGLGAHVRLPTVAIDGSIVAEGLGNLMFDQSLPDTRQGLMLEVLAGTDGVAAWRTGNTDHTTGRARFVDWDEPEGDAVLLNGEWWNLMEGAITGSHERSAPDAFPHGDAVAGDTGDIDGDGMDEIVVSFRRPFRETILNRETRERWIDPQGRSAHIGVFRGDDFSQVWVAGTLRRPVRDLAVCDGSLAVAYDTLDDDEIVAVGGWMWTGFGFIGDVDLAGSATLGCVDVDGDGSREPALTGREFRH